MSHTQRAISLLTYQELLEVKHDIEAELRRRDADKSRSRTADHRPRFAPGDQVTFVHENATYFATVIRVNTKTITVVAQSPRSGTWRISPTLLTHILSANTQ